ncbi:MULTISPECIES: winged helix-turn-helix domain-containing protein [unclassified Bradyrhizobium]|uniref:ATP-binding protein n=1 Tax=unclassified Bradyrhizobium TaxID=2631580 RepID=UPI0033910CFC
MVDEDRFAKGSFSFGPFKLVPEQRRLEKSGVPLRLSARGLDILAVLVEHAGEVVSKKDLLVRVWADVTVDEGSLRVHVAGLRKVLGDGEEGARYVTTIPGQGYCFVAPVSRTLKPVADISSLGQRPKFPNRLGRMIGRDDAVRAISSHLMAERFVSIVGPGGIGKTTLAISVGHQLTTELADQVHFIDLGSLSDPHLVAGTIGSALGFVVDDRDPIPGLLAALRDIRVLLVLDSCERVIEAASALAETIFEEAPQVCILATSRETLRVRGEHIHWIAPLEFPPEGVHMSAREALAYTAVQLFAERVAASQLRFMLNDVDAPVAAEICRRLDGIPLAIELAAGRVDAYGIHDVARLLDHKFELWRGRRTALPRHQTLTATLDWSYDLLSELEQTILRRLSVFVGPFTIEAAFAIAAGDDLDDSQVVEPIASLVAKSLLTGNARLAIPLYRLLDTTRGYVQAKLAKSGDASLVARRHAVYHLALFERIGAKLPGSRKSDNASASNLIRSMTGAESDNLTEASVVTNGRPLDEIRVALDWAHGKSGDPLLALDLTAAAAPIWIHHMLIDECRERTEQAVSRIDEKVGHDARRELRLFFTLAVAHMESTGDAAIIDDAWLRVSRLAEELDDNEYRLRSLWGLWIGRYLRGDFPGALQIAEKFVNLPDGAIDVADRFVGERILGVTLHILGDQAGARRHLEKMLAGYVAPPGQMHALRYQFDQHVAARTYHSQTLWLLGFPDQAIEVGRRAFDDATALGHEFSLLYALAYGVCPLALELGNSDAAGALISTMLHREMTFRAMGVWGRCYSGILEMKRGHTASGLALLREGLKGFPPTGFQSRYLFLLGNLALGESGIGDHRGANTTIDRALDQSERNQDRWFVAELLRIKGILALDQGGPEAPMLAEAHFNHSLEWSRRQGATSWELRTATSLACLMQKQSRFGEARELLAPLYARFSEGFTTADLVKARSLLTLLNESTP